uniref:Uncharacterized protein n=1 Tax=Avena sativa TaxID=4498 RepID=A0ACD5Y6S8_AVESA
MAEELTIEVNTSSSASAESKRDIFPVNTTDKITIDGHSLPPYLRRKEKPVPHYRRASTGSCHDSCKFGTHHSPESKEFLPVRGWRQDRANARHGKQDQAEVIPREGKAGKNKGQNPKFSSHVKPEFTEQKPPLKVVPDNNSETSPYVGFPDEVSEPNSLIKSFDDRSNCGDGELSEGAVSIDLEMPLAIQDHDEPEDHLMDVILPSEDVCEAAEQSLVDHVSDHSVMECVSSEKRSDQTVMAPEKDKKNKRGTKSKSFSLEPVKPKTKATLTIARNSVQGRKTGIKSQGKAAGTSPESSDGPRTRTKKADDSATSKFDGEKKLHLIAASNVLKLKEIKVPSPASVANLSAKSTRLLKPKVSTTKTAPDPSASSGKQTDRKMTHENVAKNTQLQQNKREKPLSSPLKLSRSINMSAKSLSSTNTRAAKKENSSSPMNSKKVYGIVSSSDSKDKIVKTASPKILRPDVINKERQSHKDQAVTARTESAGRSKLVYTSSSTVTRSPRKITFRRGKVLTNLSSNTDSNSPRRVRFRPTKATDDINISKDPVRGRIARKSRAATSDASRDSGASRAEVVVLRHQDAKEKKSKQRSFNNVIKETASRLIEARKSKVKALVGAFETVISLQEKRGRSSSVIIS